MSDIDWLKIDFLGREGDTYRTLTYAWNTFALERWCPKRRLWRLTALEREGLEQMTREEAVAIVGEESADVPGEFVALTVGLPGIPKLGKRGAWLAKRIGETQAMLHKDLPRQIGEISMSRSGSSDYEYELDVLAKVGAAIPTLAALWNELRVLQDRTARIVRDAVAAGERPPPEPGEYWE